MGPVEGSLGPERTFTQYSDDSDSDEEGDEDEDGGAFFRPQSVRRTSDQSRHQQYGASPSPQPRLTNKAGAGAGRSGLVMNVCTFSFLNHHIRSGDPISSPPLVCMTCCFHSLSRAPSHHQSTEH
jgi:hypothetical protein